MFSSVVSGRGFIIERGFCRRQVVLDPPPQELVSPRPDVAHQEKQFARVFSLIREGINQHAFPGAALAVTHRGALVASQGFGRFTYDDNAPEVQADTVFDLASITKAVATTAVAMVLHDRDRLSLEEPVAEALPEFVSLAPKHQKASREAVTVRMLLAHSSGLPAYEKLFEFATTRDDLIHAAMTTRLVAAPGERAVYSDIGFILLGELLAKKAGLALNLFARQEVFTPLGMKQTRFQPPRDWVPEIPADGG